MINIVKASAGSGKTFSLAREYIMRLFVRDGDQYSYRHILAVTFTNKATDEMKRRILKELFILASSPGKSMYLGDLMKYRPDLSVEDISAMSRRFLCNILNDYGAFSVSTIDRFFQRTLKAFSREIGQFASYQVELDKQSLVRESVDRILDSLTEDDSGLLDWLTGSVREQLMQDGRFSLEDQLYTTAEALMDEEHRELVAGLGLDEESLHSRESLKVMRDGCSAVMRGFVDRTRKAAQSVVDVLDNAGVSPQQFTRKFMTKILPYTELRDNDIVHAPTASFMANSADSSKWFPKAAAKTLLPQVETALQGPLEEFTGLFGQPFKVYNTALILRRQMYSLGISAELNTSFRELLKEKNVLSLDDSNTILKGIIDGSDAPFIYEKTGVRFDSFLLDEFQDTSNIQWENLRPLLSESNSRGNANLIVGDVKQSIYRWRNSDWNLLNTRLKEEFPDSSESVLDSNWRSVRNVVSFNNSFYTFAAAELDGMCAGEGRISGIYADVVQKVTDKGPEDGNVDVLFCNPSEETDVEIEAVLSEIRRLGENGASYSDIGILARSNAVAAAVASTLLAAGIPVISDDSLTVKSSPAVRRLTALLSYADNPGDTLNSYMAGSLGIEPPEEYHSIVDLCEYFLRCMDAVPESSLTGEIPYIQAFMDIVQDWTGVNGNSLPAFLSYWDTVDPKISSPDGSDAVKVMTIHKSKGLDFNYVIFPYAEKVTLYKADSHWCRPDVGGTELESCATGIYRVILSSGAADSLFSASYDNERLMQIVDSLNTFYVATTRARKGMTVIAAMPSAKFREYADSMLEGEQAAFQFGDLSQILYLYLRLPSSGSDFRTVPAEDGSVLRFRLGSPYPFKGEGNKLPDGVTAGEYYSWPTGSRLEFSPESGDFFRRPEEGLSMRTRGIVLHDILSRVVRPSDLVSAVEASVLDGSLEEGERPAVVDLLSARIGSVSERGWFPEDVSKVRNETTIIDSDGEIYRPDRVVVDGDSVRIVDYKFGHPAARYRDQVRNYARLYRDMGFRDVRASLWYVHQDRVEDVE
ncbi:MAG: UvrD-helicase domain-containing protein [Candidatus Cryptobacteroides sp.]